jgi:RNA polymerase sigma-70 factor (ECF subfamily)
MEGKSSTAGEPAGQIQASAAEPSGEHAGELSDAQLIRQFKEGQRSAFDRLVLRHQRRIYAITRRMSGDHDDADDLAQETFLAAYRALEGFDERKSFVAFLSRIAINLSINHLRRRKRWRNIETRHGEEARGAVTGNAGMAADRQMERDRLINRLQEAIDDLPPEQKAVLALKVDQEMSYQEIAETLGISMGTVMSRLSRARERLRRKLKENSTPSRGEFR